MCCTTAVKYILSPFHPIPPPYQDLIHIFRNDCRHKQKEKNHILWCWIYRVRNTGMIYRVAFHYKWAI